MAWADVRASAPFFAVALVLGLVAVAGVSLDLHRGQAHAMLSATTQAPPQLDEFFAEAEAPLRAAEFADLGWTEQTVWGD